VSPFVDCPGACPGPLQVLRRMTHLHSEYPNAPAAARRYVRDASLAARRRRRHGVPHVSELATNCVAPCDTDFTMTIEQTMRHVRVEIADSGSGRVATRRPEPTESAAWAPASSTVCRHVGRDVEDPDRRRQERLVHGRPRRGLTSSGDLCERSRGRPPPDRAVSSDEIIGYWEVIPPTTRRASCREIFTEAGAPYEHILDASASEECPRTAPEEIAARTVNKQRARSGEARTPRACRRPISLATARRYRRTHVAAAVLRSAV